MFKIDSSTAVTTMPTPSAYGTPGFFAHGDGVSVPYTVLTSDWANAVQMEIANVVTAAGLSLDKTNQSQLLAALALLGRTKLTGALNLYVSSAGSDLNNGLSSGTPFLTLQQACNVALANYDTAGFPINVNVASGTYTAGVLLTRPLVGGGVLHFIGNTTTPTTVSVNLVSSGPCFLAQAAATMSVSGFSMTASVGSGLNTGYCIGANLAGVVYFDHCIFNAAQYAHLTTGIAGYISATGPYTISASAQVHMIAGSGGSEIVVANQTVTLAGTPTFTYAFAAADSAALVYAGGNTYSGGATGTRYIATNGGYIISNGAGASYFPGTVAGISTTGYYE
jgi:hypothetical protein